MIDSLTDLLFPDHGVRGAYVDLRSGIQDLLGWRAYSTDVFRLLGHSIAAAPLLASHAKFDGRMSLQFQGTGPLKLLVTQVGDSGAARGSQLEVRGMAKADPAAQGDVRALMGEGVLALLLEPGRGTQHYRALVPIEGASLAQALEAYFERSEQLPTLFWLAASRERLCGLMLQRMPARDTAADDEHWRHLTTLAATAGEEEMLSVDGMTLLHRLFHAEDRRIFEPRPVRLACRCSHASISNMLLSLGEAELSPVLEQQGRIEVTCEFCGRAYGYDDLEVRSLFAAARSEPQTQTRQ